MTPDDGSKRAVFRCDASPAIGSGHLQRCLTLARALRGEGWQCSFAVCRDAPAMVPTLTHSGFSVHVLDAGEVGNPAALHAFVPDGCSLLVVDHYELDESYETACRPWASRILVIDDLANRSHDCDLLLDAAPRRFADYDGLVPGSCRRLVGPSYALIRQAFLERRQRALLRNRERPLERIAISFGGSDNKQLTIPAIREAATVAANTWVDVYAAGAAYASAAEVAMTEHGLRGEVLGYVDDPAERLSLTDLAIGAGGVSVWERCVLGLPSLVVQTSDNQQANVKALMAAGAADVVDLSTARRDGQLGGQLATLCGDGDRRAAMSMAAARLCDGRGALRVVAEVDPPASRLGRPIRLRSASMDDAGMILHWQRQPGMRQHFRNPQPPSEEEHWRWMTNYLSKGAGNLMIIEHGDQDAGLLRLDSGITDMEISILVAPESQGAGIGTKALHLARKIWPEVELTAEVLPANSASHAMFRRAGFTWTGERFTYPAIASADADPKPARSAQ